MPVDEADRLQSYLRGRQVLPAEEDVHVLREADERFVHAGDPVSYGIPADHRVRHARLVEGGRRAEQTFAHFVHGAFHAIQELQA